MAKFRDKTTGNVFVFELEHDIKSLRDHPDYEEVVDEIIDYTVAEEPIKVQVKKTKTKGKE